MAAPKSSAVNSEDRKVRRLNGDDVKPVLYNGKYVGHGKYFAGEIKGKLVEDKDGKPIPYRKIGSVEAI